MDEKAEDFCAGIFAREIQVKPETMIKRLIMMHTFGEGVRNKEHQPSWNSQKWSDMEFQTLRLNYFSLYWFLMA